MRVVVRVEECTGQQAAVGPVLAPCAMSTGQPPSRPAFSPPLPAQGNTHDSLQEMGRRLAAEMAEFLAPFSRAARRPLRKITLVGERSPHQEEDMHRNSSVQKSSTLSPRCSSSHLLLSPLHPEDGQMSGTNTPWPPPPPSPRPLSQANPPATCMPPEQTPN